MSQSWENGIEILYFSRFSGDGKKSLPNNIIVSRMRCSLVVKAELCSCSLCTITSSLNINWSPTDRNCWMSQRIIVTVIFSCLFYSQIFLYDFQTAKHFVLLSTRYSKNTYGASRGKLWQTDIQIDGETDKEVPMWRFAVVVPLIAL